MFTSAANFSWKTFPILIKTSAVAFGSWWSNLLVPQWAAMYLTDWGTDISSSFHKMC